MNNIKLKWRMLAAASVAAVSLVGCHDDGTSTVPTPPPPQAADFSLFVNQVFMMSANSTPAPVNGVNFTFDVNDNPTAFDALITTGTF